jgi:hypothetical protein
MRVRSIVLLVVALSAAGCGGSAKSPTLDLAAVPQPTPDPTLDAVVRDLPRALAGVLPTPTPTARVIPTVSKPAVKPPTSTPTAAIRPPTPKPAVRQSSPSPTIRR